MRCPVCNAPSSRVLDSRPSKGGIRRRRRCKSFSGHLFTTFELIDPTGLRLKVGPTGNVTLVRE